MFDLELDDDVNQMFEILVALYFCFNAYLPMNTPETNCNLYILVL